LTTPSNKLYDKNVKRKLLYTLFTLLLLLPIFSNLATPAHADIGTCTVAAHSVAKSTDTHSAPADTGDKYIALYINYDEALKSDSEKVSVYINNTKISGYSDIAPDANGVIKFPKLNSNFSNQNSDNKWDNANRTYTVTVVPQGNSVTDTPLCSSSFQIAEENYCTVTLDSSNTLKPNDKIKFSVNFSSGGENTGDGNTHEVKLYKVTGEGQPVDVDFTTSELRSGKSIPLDNITIPTGKYIVEVSRLSCKGTPIPGCNPRPACWSQPLTISPTGGTVGCTDNSECRFIVNGVCQADGSGNRTCQTKADNSVPYVAGHVALACKQKSAGSEKFTCNTAIGEISTDPQDFIKDILALVLSLAGGILLILIIVNGFKLMTSQGDPEKIKDAREGIIAAITGLLLIIFSLVILRILLVNVLNIPGFG
jgi:hypothetical protein